MTMNAQESDRSGEVPAVVVHVPHASSQIPADVRGQFVLDDAALRAEHLAITDWFTDELFALPETVACQIVFPISRLVVDPERFTDDAKEPMAARGMGVVYTGTTDGGVLRHELEAASRDQLIRRFYEPHHERLEKAVADALAVHDRCLIIDAHSFPDRPLACHTHLYGDQASPDICIGTDEYHTPAALTALASQAFRADGWSVDIDQPFSGTLVPASRYRRDKRVWSIMVEVNRDLYMDPASGERLQHFDRVRSGIERALGCLLQSFQEGLE